MKAEISRGGQIDLFGPLTERTRTIIVTPPVIKIEVDVTQMDSNDFIQFIEQTVLGELEAWLAAELPNVRGTG